MKKLIAVLGLALAAFAVNLSAVGADADMENYDPRSTTDLEGNVYPCMEWSAEHGCLYARIPVNGGTMEHYVTRQGIRTSRYVPDESDLDTEPPEGWH